MIFGVGSVITMLAVGAGARAEILARIGELGVTNIILNSVKPPEESKPDDAEQWSIKYGLTFDDAEYIERNVPICTKTDESCPQYRPNSDDAMYVLEVTGGTVDGYKIEKGSKLQFGQP